MNNLVAKILAYYLPTSVKSSIFARNKKHLCKGLGTLV